jgi:hypothetical protein
MKQRARYYLRRRKTLFWLFIILIVSIVLGALTGGIPFFIETFHKYRDTSYTPMDTDRMTYEQEKSTKVKR